MNYNSLKDLQWLFSIRKYLLLSTYFKFLFRFLAVSKLQLLFKVVFNYLQLKIYKHLMQPEDNSQIRSRLQIEYLPNSWGKISA